MNIGNLPKWLMLLLSLVSLTALAGCVDDEQQATDDDIGEGIAEPEPDVGPAEEEVAPATEDEIGGEEETGFAEDEATV